MTPNQFELEVLTGIEVHTLADAKRATQVLHDQGVSLVLLTSLMRADGHPDEIEMLLSSKEEGCLLIATPKLQMQTPINGSGDATAAIFLAHYLESKNLKQSLEQTTNSIFALFNATKQKGRRELDLVGGQAAWIAPVKTFDAAPC
jgi:pyridoxine kinase